jgi:hypothetical protein
MTEVQGARRALLDAIYAIYDGEGRIRIDEQLAQNLERAWEEYDAAILAPLRSITEAAMEAFVRRAAAEGTPAWVVELAISEGSPRWLDFLAGWEARAHEADELLYLAWTVIANAGQGMGGWKHESTEWVGAAERWRDRWHDFLRPLTPPAAPSRAEGEVE